MKPMVGFAAVAMLEHSCRIVAASLVAELRDHMNASGTNMERIFAGRRRRRRWPYYSLAPCHWYAAVAAVPDHNNGNHSDC